MFIDLSQCGTQDGAQKQINGKHKNAKIVNGNLIILQEGQHWMQTHVIYI